MLTLHSPAFKAGGPIPRRYTGEGEDVSPPLEIGGVPAGTRELVLIADDPDAPREDPWVHWVLFHVPPSTRTIPEGLPAEANVPKVGGATQGRNDFGRPGYGGPMPPPGHGLHHYHFKLYALDVTLPLRDGATKGAVLSAMNGHVLEMAEVVGTYERFATGAHP